VVVGAGETPDFFFAAILPGNSDMLVWKDTLLNDFLSRESAFRACGED
jgi:hypothetical protein